MLINGKIQVGGWSRDIARHNRLIEISPKGFDQVNDQSGRAPQTEVGNGMQNRGPRIRRLLRLAHRMGVIIRFQHRWNQSARTISKRRGLAKHGSIQGPRNGHDPSHGRGYAETGRAEPLTKAIPATVLEEMEKALKLSTTGCEGTDLMEPDFQLTLCLTQFKAQGFGRLPAVIGAQSSLLDLALLPKPGRNVISLGV